MSLRPEGFNPQHEEDQEIKYKVKDLVEMAKIRKQNEEESGVFIPEAAKQKEKALNAKKKTSADDTVQNEQDPLTREPHPWDKLDTPEKSADAFANGHRLFP